MPDAAWWTSLTMPSTVNFADAVLLRLLDRFSQRRPPPKRRGSNGRLLMRSVPRSQRSRRHGSPDQAWQRKSMTTSLVPLHATAVAAISSACFASWTRFSLIFCRPSQDGDVLLADVHNRHLLWRALFRLPHDKDARAMATCADPQLAATEIDPQAGLRKTLARVDAETTSALREDQRKFLVDLDRGFRERRLGPGGDATGRGIAHGDRADAPGADDDPLGASKHRCATCRLFAQPGAAHVGDGPLEKQERRAADFHVDPDLAAQPRSAKGGVNFGDDDRGIMKLPSAWGSTASPRIIAISLRRSEPLQRPACVRPRNTDAGVDQDIAAIL